MFYAAIKIDWIPATFCSNSCAAKPVKEKNVKRGCATGDQRSTLILADQHGRGHSWALAAQLEQGVSPLATKGRILTRDGFFEIWISPSVHS